MKILLLTGQGFRFRKNLSDHDSAVNYDHFLFYIGFCHLIAHTNPMMDDTPKSRTKLAEVAKRAGVSEITASRALRGGQNVSAATLARVEKAASELGYVRNRLAGALAGGPSNQIGVVLPSLSNIVFPDVLKGLEDRLEADGYHPVLGISNYDAAREEKLLRSLLSWRPAGLVVASSGLTQGARALLGAADLPVVEIMDIDTTPVDMAVGISHHAAGKAMGYFLTGRGHRRFGYIGHDLDHDKRAAARLDGFRAALTEGGIAPPEVLTRATPSSVALGRELMARMLDIPDHPDVVYFSNDDMAVGGMFECQARGLSVPDDIALAGFNGLDIGQSLPVPLTTIGSNRHRIGSIAAEQILRRIAGEPTEARVDVGFSLLRGNSA